MNYGSVCSGIEAATLAWQPLGWNAKFFAEVEPFPSAVLQQKFDATKPLRPLDPAEACSDKDRKLRESWARQIAELPDTGTLPNLGDFTKISTEDYNGTIDLIVGGTPCQSYSIAGLRKGLSDPRGNLALEFVKLAFRTNARWTVWENVPGVLSSGAGKDFASFLSLLCGWEIDVPKNGWKKCGIVTPAPGCFGLAWRILDAQYTRVPEFPRAVPQRRRRLFVIGHLGSWQYPAKVLFDGEMRGGDTPPRRTKRQTPPVGLEGGADTAESIRMRSGCPGGGKGALVSKELSLTLATGNDQTIITHPDVECLDMRQIEANSQGCAPTLIATDYKGGKAVSFYPYLQKECPIEECANTLINGDCPGHQNAVVIDEDKACPTLDANYPGKMNFQDVDKLVCYEHHPQDARIKETDVNSTLGTFGNSVEGKDTVICFEKDPVGFIKNDAGSEVQGYWKEVFPTVRSQVIPAIAYNVTFCDANGTRNDRPNGGLYVTKADAGNTVTAGGTRTDTVVVEGEESVGVDPYNMAVTGNVAATLGVNCGISTGRNGVCEDPVALDGDKMAKAERKGGSGLGVSTEGVMYTQTVKDVHAVAYAESEREWQAAVRRLLPVECERLMGFPDGHTLIKWKGKPESECPDAPRYKACGNSMCVNAMAWIGARIDAVEKEIQLKKGEFLGE